MARREDGRGPARPIEAVPPPAAEDVTWERLEDQLGWYDRKSRDNQRRYQWLKLLELAVAAVLPVVAGVGSPVWITGGLAAVIVVLEGVQHLSHSMSSGSPTAPLPRRSSTSAICIWLGPVRIWGRIARASWPSGSKAWSHRSTPSGRPATNRPRVPRKVTVKARPAGPSGRPAGRSGSTAAVSAGCGRTGWPAPGSSAPSSSWRRSLAVGARGRLGPAGGAEPVRRPGRTPPPDGETATALFSLDETAKYFLVLTALCEPRLRDGSSAALPTDPQILDRLRRLPSCRHLTRSAVNFHLDYLALLPSHRGPGATPTRIRG